MCLNILSIFNSYFIFFVWPNSFTNVHNFLLMMLLFCTKEGKGIVLEIHTEFWWEREEWTEMFQVPVASTDVCLKPGPTLWNKKQKLKIIAPYGHLPSVSAYLSLSSTVFGSVTFKGYCINNLNHCIYSKSKQFGTETTVLQKNTLWFVIDRHKLKP